MRDVGEWTEQDHRVPPPTHATLAAQGEENSKESFQPVQDWIVDLRRRGLAVLQVHHAGKGGEQRGSSGHEDVLDVVIRLERPRGYKPQDGARFVVRYDKFRGKPSGVEPFEARLHDDGHLVDWELRDAALDEEQEERDARIREMHAQGATDREIATAINYTESGVCRARARLNLPTIRRREA